MNKTKIFVAAIFVVLCTILMTMPLTACIECMQAAGGSSGFRISWLVMVGVVCLKISTIISFVVLFGLRFAGIRPKSRGRFVIYLAVMTLLLTLILKILAIVIL